MRRLTSFTIALALTAHPAMAASNLETAVDRAIKAKGLGDGVKPGCAVSVARGEEVLVSKGYGSANLEFSVPFTPKTVSETGSIAKQFTAASIFMLAEQGRLSLDDDIRKHLPEMPDLGVRIQIHHLIHQTSGLREWSTLAALRGFPRHFKRIYDNDQVLKLIANQRALNFAPGERYEYSNSNYALLTIIAERASGLSMAQLGQAQIFGPLGMNSTQWRDDLRDVVPGRAVAYRPKASGYELGMPFESVYGHGALLTTVEDLQIWNRALHGGRLSSFVTKAILTRGQLSNGEPRAYGGGVILAEHRGYEVARHGGSTAGYGAQLWAFPKQQLSIALLCNVRQGEAEIAADIADAALGLSPAPAIARETSQSVEPTEYYVSSAGGVIAFTRDERARASANLFLSGGALQLRNGERPGTFSAPTPLGELHLSQIGDATIIAALEGREPSLYRRLEGRQSEISITGRYLSKDLDAAYDVVRQDDGVTKLNLSNPDADEPVTFQLQWLVADTYLAKPKNLSGFWRDNMIVTFSRSPDGARILRMSSVMGLQAVDGLEFSEVRAPGPTGSRAP